MIIKINSEEELISVAIELAHCLCNLRKFTKLWEQDYGVELKARKKYWEKKADELIQRLQVTEHRNKEQLKIEVNAKENTKASD